MKRKTKATGKVGDDLRSREHAFQVPSALAGLTAGFEKGPGVPPPLETPTNLSLTKRSQAHITKRKKARLRLEGRRLDKRQRDKFYATT